MTALSSARPIDQVASYLALSQCGVDAGATKIQEGAMVTALTATGYAVRAGTGSAGAVQGVAAFEVDASADSVDGTHSVDLLNGLFWRPNSGDVTQAHFGKVIYAADDQTVTATVGTNSVAGICCGVDSTQGVLVLITAGLNYLLAQATLTANLASTANGLGASLIGVEDAGLFTTAATAEACIAELYAKVQKRTLTATHATITAAAATETIAIGAALPASSRIIGVTMHTYTPFTGGTISDFTVDVGAAGDVDALIDGADLFTAAVDGGPATMTKGISPDKFYSSATQLNAVFRCGSDDVADATAGAVTIDVLYVVLT